jgi:hypothetical protein
MGARWLLLPALALVLAVIFWYKPQPPRWLVALAYAHATGGARRFVRSHHGGWWCALMDRVIWADVASALGDLDDIDVELRALTE